MLLAASPIVTIAHDNRLMGQQRSERALLPEADAMVDEAIDAGVCLAGFFLGGCVAGISDYPRNHSAKLATAFIGTVVAGLPMLWIEPDTKCRYAVPLGIVAAAFVIPRLRALTVVGDRVGQAAAWFRAWIMVITTVGMAWLVRNVAL